jgi:hypothetical protein
VGLGEESEKEKRPTRRQFVVSERGSRRLAKGDKDDEERYWDTSMSDG